MTLLRLLQLAGVAVLVMATEMACVFLYMVVYGHAINPGHPEQYYQDHVKVAAPYCSFAAGIPIFFLAGWWVTGWSGSAGVTAAQTMWLSYVIVDVVFITVAGGWTPHIARIVAASLVAKLIAAYAGARIRIGYPRGEGFAQPSA